MRVVVFNVMKLRPQTFLRNAKSAGNIVFQVPYLRSVAKPISNLTQYSCSCSCLLPLVPLLPPAPASCPCHLNCCPTSRKQYFLVQVGGRVAGDTDMIDVLNLNTRRCQTVPHRLRRKAGAMFDAIESLLFNRRDQSPIFNDRRSRITVISVYTKNVH